MSRAPDVSGRLMGAPDSIAPRRSPRDRLTAAVPDQPVPRRRGHRTGHKIGRPDGRHGSWGKLCWKASKGDQREVMMLQLKLNLHHHRKTLHAEHHSRAGS